MTTLISYKKWDSKSELHAHLEEIGHRTLIVGLTAESPRDFFSFSIMSEFGAAEIGVFSSGLGIAPSIVVLDSGQRALVGHDMWLTWIDLQSLSIMKSQRFDGAFYEFLSIDCDDEIIVLHELGALRVDAQGSIKWTVDTDVVEDSRVDPHGKPRSDIDGSRPTDHRVVRIRNHTAGKATRDSD